MSNKITFYIAYPIFYGCLCLVHFFILDSIKNPVYQTSLLKSYGINIGLYAMVVMLCFLLKEKAAKNIGIVYYPLFVLKALIIFRFFMPLFNADDKIDTTEFLIFFIPYAINLIMSVLFLTVILNGNKKMFF